MLADAHQLVTDRLRAAGIDVVDDPRNLTPPGTLVGPPSRGQPTGTMAWETVVPVRVLGAPPGNLDALTWLMDTVDRALVALGAGVPFETGTETVAGKECPMYLLSVPVTVTAPCP